jgi:Mrp family chromosome partitioning ATPase/capsular polysaccharide biosynthesis protein
MNENTDATAIFAPIWRRKWLILIIAVIVAGASYYYYKREAKIYSASTQVYLGNGAEEQSELGSGSGGVKKSAALVPSTQAALINSSIVREAVRHHLRKQHKTPATRAALKGKAKAKSATKSEFITVSAEAHNARGTALLANTTAQVYVKRVNEHHRRQIESAIALNRRQVRKIEAGEVVAGAGHGKKSGGKSSSSASATLQAATLSSKINQLESQLAIMEVAQVDPATRKSTQLLSPHPKSNAIFGFAIGLLLAAITAYILGRLDRRLRSLAAIEGVYQAQILTALESVKRPVVRRDGHPAPARSLREALWRLQTTLQVGNPQGNGGASPARLILFVSADPGDGKSTLAAALALAQAQSGERVAVIEADFRRPVQAGLLNVAGPQGLADVLAGRLTVEEALQPVSIARSDLGVSAVGKESPAPATVLESTGSVSLLAGTTAVDNPPALLARETMADLPRSLLDEFDYVLIDAPPPLQVSDVMPLLAAVDGIVLVARIGHTRENSARRLVQLLQQTQSAPLLGVVANAVSHRDIEKYGLAAQYGRGWRHKLIRR